MRERFSGPQRFDLDYVQELMREGMSYEEALYEASATIAGSYENPDGAINAWQTYCQVLGYDEGLPPRQD